MKSVLPEMNDLEKNPDNSLELRMTQTEDLPTMQIIKEHEHNRIT